jgi:HSP20 family protein
MPITDLLPWNHNKERYSIQRRDELDPMDLQRQMLKEFFEDSPSPFGLRQWMDKQEQFIPRMDISESDKEIQVHVDLPGMDENDIELTVENYQLTIRGEKKFETEEKGQTYHRVERKYGSFVRRIQLPEDIVPDQIKAVFQKGVLVVTVPKPKESVSQRRQIPIKLG